MEKMEPPKEKRKNRQYTAETLQQAVQEVKDGRLTAWKAHNLFKVPFTTIKEYLDENHSGKVGGKMSLSDEDEDSLVGWIKDWHAVGQPMTRRRVCMTAYFIMKRRQNPKEKESSFEAGEGDDNFLFDLEKRMLTVFFYKMNKNILS